LGFGIGFGWGYSVFLSWIFRRCRRRERERNQILPEGLAESESIQLPNYAKPRKYKWNRQ